MVKEVVRDPMFLQRKSVEANMSDMPIAVDLLDTLKANFEGCVGMAANMIGVSKRIIAISDNGKYILMFIKYANDKFKTVTRTFTNFTAQIIQHEIDHCNGILI